jgi:hypothetical protein
MNAEDQYILAVIRRHMDAPEKGWSTTLAAQLKRRVEALLGSWAYREHLESVKVSGSHAKGTALRGGDIDLFLSMAPKTPGPVAPLQISLANHFRYYTPEVRNVSVRIRMDGHAIDLVAGRRREGSGTHTLWQSRFNTWVETDLEEQIRRVRESGLLDEIRAVKIWARRNELRFPSFVQERAVMRATRAGRPIAESFMAVLSWLDREFVRAKLSDPEAMTQVEKLRVAAAAWRSVGAREWTGVI